MRLLLSLTFLATLTLSAQDPAALVRLGTSYARGIGVPKDPAQAVSLWRQAAALGSADAEYHLGLAHRTGKGVQKDPAQAIIWLTKSASHGNTKAAETLTDIEERKAYSQKPVLSAVTACPWTGAIPYCRQDR